jgi:plasmid stabilization system protein ParE
VEALTHLFQEAGGAVARRFLAGLEQTYALVLAHPEAGRLYLPEHPALSELRVFRVRRFERTLVFYESAVAARGWPAPLKHRWRDGGNEHGADGTDGGK